MALHEKSFRPVHQRKKEKKEHSLGHRVNDSPGILFYDNKRRCPLGKAGSRCPVHATRTSPALPRSISLSLFALSRWPPRNVVKEQRVYDEAGEWEEMDGGVSVNSPCQTNDSFRAGKSLDFRGPAFVLSRLIFSRSRTSYFVQLPLEPVCCRKFIALTTLDSCVSPLELGSGTADKTKGDTSVNIFSYASPYSKGKGRCTFYKKISRLVRKRISQTTGVRWKINNRKICNV